LENDVGSDPNDAASTPMQIGLQAYYPLDGDASDTSGNNYDGELAGTSNDPTSSYDRFNQPSKSYYFDGGDRLKLDHRGLHGFSEFSISMWAKINSFDNWPLFLSAANGSSDNELMFIPGNTKKFLFKGPSSTQSFVFNDWLNNWKNLTLSKASSSAPIKVYVDGELENSYNFSSSGSLNISSGGLWLGADQDSVGGGWQNGQALNGWLDDIRFYNRALSAEEVNATYQVTKFTNVAPNDLSISSGTVTENGSVGDTVGNFSATDANDPHNISSYTYTLVSGSGSTDNALFTLESNGTLKAGAVFDYEEQTTRSIRVQVSDEYAATYEEVFVISIADVDDTAPAITRTGDQDVTHEAATIYTDLGATANDTLDGNLTSNLLTTGTVDINTPGTYTLTYTVSDAAGNAAISVTRNVTVVDTTAPVITRTGDQNITHETATIYTDLGATANDTLDGNLTANVVTAGTVDINTPGTYTLTYTVSDAAGNAAISVTRNVTVVDTIAPVITRTGDQNVTHEAATSYTDPGASANDTLDGNLTASVLTTGTVDINTPGTYTLTYTVSDAAGNAATSVTRNVTVVDTTAPIITRTGDQNITHEAATSYTDQGATANDTLEGNLSANVVTTGTVDTTTPGTYTLTYTVSDAAGNGATTQQREITVEDKTTPVIALEGNATVDLWVWETYTEDGATASDTLDGNLTGAITISGTVDTGTPGTYTLTYTVSDTAGNAATPLTRAVTVINRAPTSLTLSNQSVEEGWHAGTLVGSLTTTDPDDATGSRAYTYQVVSGSGYTINGSQLVTASVLDFETVPSTDVFIRTSDQFGGSYEQSFAIATIDAFVPGVSTLSASGVTSSSALLSGKVEDAGHGGGVTEHGFVIGREPDPEKAGGTTLTAAINGTALSATASGLIAGRVYFYKAYARNAEGIAYGAQERFVTPEEIGSDLWASAQSVGANWLQSDWFGTFYLTDTPWLYHHGLGWMFTIGTNDSDLWIWNDDLGWVWTARGVFPHLYSHQESEWYHWNGSTDELRLFYRYSDAKWVDFSNSSTGGKP
jgi:PKD repeat protein